MSLLSRIARYNPVRVIRTVDTVPKLRAFAADTKQVQKETNRLLTDINARLAAIDERLREHEEELAVLPRLRKTIRQYAAAYQSDLQHAARISQLGGLLDAASVRAHVAASVDRAHLEDDPCPHIVVDTLLPPALYDELIASMPDTEFFDKQDQNRGEMSVPFVFASAYTHAVWDFFHDQIVQGALLDSVVKKFRPAADELVAKYWPAYGSWAGAAIEPHVINSRLMLRKPGYEIKPHRDPRWAFWTTLIYLQKPTWAHRYGTQFYRMKQERESPHGSPFWVDYAECELVRDVPAAPNRALVFLNSRGVHGASIPSDAPVGLERFLYQIQMGPDEATRQRLIDALPPEARGAWAAGRGSAY